MTIPMTHWLLVGDISEAARSRIKNSGGTVRKVDSGSGSLYLVGIPCQLLSGGKLDTDVRYHTWTRSQEAMIEVPSQRLKLSWISAASVPPMEASAHNTTLDVWREE
jgi:hypothetical protein